MEWNSHLGRPMDRLIRHGEPGLAKRVRHESFAAFAVTLECRKWRAMSSTPLSSITPTAQAAGRSARDRAAHRDGWRALASLTVSCVAGIALALSHEHESLFPLALVAIAAS